MTSKVEICETVLQKLTYADKPCTGKIYGIYGDNNVIIIGLQRNLVTDKILDISNSFPTPIQCCGTFTVDTKDTDCKFDLSKFHVFCNLTTKEVVITSILENKSIKASYEVVCDTDIFARYWILQVKGSSPFRCEASKTSIQESFRMLQSQISSENVAFRVAQLRTYVLHSNVICSTQQEKMTIKQLFESLNELQEEPNRKKRGKAISPTTFDAEFLQRMSVREIEVSLNHAPLCILDKSTKKIINTFCKINALAMISLNAQLSDIYSILQQALLRYCSQYESKFWPCFEENINLEIDAYHFYPRECGHFLTLLYPAAKSDRDLETERLNLHQQLMLNENVPLFRRANKFISNRSNGPLINPHIGVRMMNNGGNICLVRGNYEYYHYCQNGMDDSGWGCAYRSLQTLASWLKLQGYVDREVPTFHDIQKCLVDIKDKPSSFLGSKQWIGSTEVNFVLDSLLGITCKILYVSSGEEMSQKGPELADHFNNQGSPIMIGGGVLAHTILGVDYNPQTGNIYFLILDPHYTGSEDLHTIQSKGWCGWKPVSFWQKGSYYNLCLPQVPKGV